ncbi:MAG TPA: response regulator transcription factor [Phycisphaerae bacterium]|nr:response regulator transcription factor [Phycisphaerales bacterium]HRX83938.1 response regulator transcription factor [Phycisphaerae bacterium]
MAPVRVLIVDDHGLVRQTLKERLMREPDLAVVGCAGDRAGASALLRASRPDVALLDLHLDGADGLDVLRAARREELTTRFIVVSAFSYDRYIEAALALDARGYITKNEPAAVLIDAIHDVAAGGKFFSQAVRARLVPAPSRRREAVWQTRSATLTQRQRDVLMHIARGLSKSEVAQLLGLSRKTVETHCEMMMRRLVVRDRVELARFAIREGLVEA